MSDRKTIMKMNGTTVRYWGFLAVLLMMTLTLSMQAAKIRVLFDSDANNELDDQHALAYLLFNGDVFDLEGVTVNRTRNGGDVSKHKEEAERVVKLCALHPQVKVHTGANGEFNEIKDQVHQSNFDGSDAVNLIIERAHAQDERRLILLPVGKLTNIALALKKDPTIIPKVKVVWLGSNYPEKGEYNQVNDEPSLNYVLETNVELEVAIVRYGKPSGTDAVRASIAEIRRIMPGKGPKVPPVIGRHGKSFSSFGDYAIDLFENIKLHGDPPSRALFDMAAVAIVKNPKWARANAIPAPILKEDGTWEDRPQNKREIVIWEDFDRKAIMEDFYESMSHPVLVSGTPR